MVNRNCVLEAEEEKGAIAVADAEFKKQCARDDHGLRERKGAEGRAVIPKNVDNKSESKGVRVILQVEGLEKIGREGNGEAFLIGGLLLQEY